MWALRLGVGSFLLTTIEVDLRGWIALATSRHRAFGLVVELLMTPTGMLALYTVCALGLVAAFLLLAGRLAPLKPSPTKDAPYECGVSEAMPVQARWPVRFALVAMLFLIFDVEGLFFYPWAVLLRELRWNGLMAMASFFAVLGVGYMYARSRDALSWK
jgi:NADH-quinone oxidoreductase subunit A